MHYKQRQVELKSGELFQSKMIREHMAVSKKKKSHDCLEAGLHCFRIESLSFGAFSSSSFFCCWIFIYLFIYGLLQQTMRVRRMFMQNKHSHDTPDSGCSPTLN